MNEELVKRIASYSPELVSREGSLAQKLYNECRRAVGKSEVKFAD